MSMPPPSLLLGDEYKDIMQSEHRDDQWQNGGITANDLEAWKWEDRHGYNNENSNEAIQLFAERGLICITETNTSFESVGIGRRKEKWTIKKYVTVQSLDMHEVPIQATEDTRENAERQCNLMILGELFRCEIIGPVEDELLQYLPTDIQSTISTDTANTNKFELPAITTDTANTDKFESPAITTTTVNTNKFELPAITTTTVNMNKFELPNQVLTSFPNQVRTSFSNQMLTSLPNTPTSGATGSASIPAGFSHQPSANANTSTTFLGNIGTGQGQNRMGGGGGRGPGPNARERDEYDRFRYHPDLQRRKFAVQKKTMDEAIEEQCQVNTGPVRQANIAVKVEGGGNNGVNVEQIKIKSFNDLALTPQLKTTLNDINYFEPTNLQKYVIPLIQHTGNDILCLAATGSGKSGAFLIPLVHRLQGLRYTPRGELKPVNKTTPLAIVVAHTKELVQQLYDNAYIFANQTQVGVAIARGQMSNQDLRGYLTAGCDILVTTPGKLSQFLAENWIQLNCVQFVIIDEVDKFVNDDQMVNVLYKLREKLHQTKNATYRFLMFSATFNISAENKIVDLLRPNYYAVVTQNVNQTVAHVHQKICLVDSKNWGRNPRLQMLKNLLQRLSTRIVPQQEHFCFETPKTIVFVNEGRTSDRVAVALSYWGYKAMSVNGRRSMEQRTKAVEEFKRGKWPILVATDVISRGINLPNVKFVIVYEMPPYERCEQYIHRIGRVGRVGTDDGHAFVFFDPELPNEEMLAEFLYKQLLHSKQPIPKFLEKMLAEKLQLEQMLKQNQQQPRMRSSPMGHQNNNNNSSEVQPTWNNGGGW